MSEETKAKIEAAVEEVFQAVLGIPARVADKKIIVAMVEGGGVNWMEALSDYLVDHWNCDEEWVKSVILEVSERQ